MWMRSIAPAGRAQLLQHAQRGQCVDRGLGEAEVALVEHRWQRAGRRRFDQADVEADALERDGQAGADQAAADDEDVVKIGPAESDMPTAAEMRGRELGGKQALRYASGS